MDGPDGLSLQRTTIGRTVESEKSICGSLRDPRKMEADAASYLLGVSAISLGLLFMFASATKAVALKQFARTLLFVPHLPAKSVIPVAFAISLAK